MGYLPEGDDQSVLLPLRTLRQLVVAIAVFPMGAYPGYPTQLLVLEPTAPASVEKVRETVAANLKRAVGSQNRAAVLQRFKTLPATLDASRPEASMPESDLSDVEQTEPSVIVPQEGASGTCICSVSLIGTFVHRPFRS